MDAAMNSAGRRVLNRLLEAPVAGGCGRSGWEGAGFRTEGTERSSGAAVARTADSVA